MRSVILTARLFLMITTSPRAMRRPLIAEVDGLLLQLVQLDDRAGAEVENVTNFHLCLAQLNAEGNRDVHDEITRGGCGFCGHVGFSRDGWIGPVGGGLFQGVG